MMHILRERSAKWNERKGRCTATIFDDRQLNECMVATTLSGLHESSAYVAGFFTIGGIDWTKPTLRPRFRETTLRKQILRLKRLLANKTLEVDFFRHALQRVGARRHQKANSGDTASTMR